MPSAWVMSMVCSVSSQLPSKAAGAGPVRGYQRDRNIVGLAGVRIVCVQVGQIGAGIFQQAERLAVAGESCSAVIRRAHVAAAEGGRRAGAGGGHRLHARASVNEGGLRNGVVVQAGNVPEPEREIQRGFAIGRIEGAVFGGVLVEAHGHMEGRLDAGHGPVTSTFMRLTEVPTTVKPCVLAKLTTAS